MAAAMARKKNQITIVKFSCQELIGGIAKRRCHFDPLISFKPINIIKPASPYNSNFIHHTGCYLELFRRKTKIKNNKKTNNYKNNINGL